MWKQFRSGTATAEGSQRSKVYLICPMRDEGKIMYMATKNMHVCRPISHPLPHLPLPPSLGWVSPWSLFPGDIRQLHGHTQQSAEPVPQPSAQGRASRRGCQAIRPAQAARYNCWVSLLNANQHQKVIRHRLVPVVWYWFQLSGTGSNGQYCPVVWYWFQWASIEDMCWSMVMLAKRLLTWHLHRQETFHQQCAIVIISAVISCKDWFMPDPYLSVVLLH